MYYLFFILIIFIKNSFAFDFDVNLARKKIRNTEGVFVTYKNHLGEGDGQFDSMPRYNPENVNCTTWWQQILAETYAGENSEAIISILDSIRYFDGVISFGTRKHFLDQVFIDDSNPFENIENKMGMNCQGDLNHDFNIEFEKFKKSAKYNCPLIYENFPQITFTYLSPEKAISCMRTLPDGIYLAFPVAGNRYNAIWGKKSGPMGRVHGLFVDKQNGQSQVFHASIDRGKVANEPFEQYILSAGSGLFKGYSIFTISAKYFPTKGEISSKGKEIINCEKLHHAKK